ncbi:hypothetical protein K3495_g6758 [Podosphaera aphanis]|nr:hypothetical protein K3495_g6758 [Podosphaera aphanis]
MNAHALLTSQGWRGTGNSLHPTSNAIGLSKPLLVARKDDNHGIGKKHSTSDMWWMNAFDKTLQGLDTSKEGKVLQTVTNGSLDVIKRGGGKWVLEKGGLYANFVKGEGLAGSLTLTDERKIRQSKKRKREASEPESKLDKSARKAKRALEKRAKKEKEKMTPEICEKSTIPEHENSHRKKDDQARDVLKVQERVETREEKIERRRLRRQLRKEASAKETENSHNSKQKKKKALK